MKIRVFYGMSSLVVGLGQSRLCRVNYSSSCARLWYLVDLDRRDHGQQGLEVRGRRYEMSFRSRLRKMVVPSYAVQGIVQ